jgi:homoserine kinase type II
MAVLTNIDERDAQALLTDYGLGPVRRLVGIAGGSVNSNFAIEGDALRFFLRLYEEQDLHGARRETAMLERLASAGVPTPQPLRRGDGGLVSVVRGKPAALFPWRDGGMRCQAAVTAEDTWRVGKALALLHVAGRAEAPPAGRFGYEPLLARVRQVAASGHPTFAPLAPTVEQWLDRARAARDPDLPGGLVHGDLFRDNVLWNGDEIAALLDFESACAGTYAYDLMVTVLSWCFGDDFDGPLATSMRAGYESVRPLSEAEKEGLYAEAAFAALRFTVTRITDYAMRSETSGPRSVKDWRRFERRYERLTELGPSGVRALVGSR